MAANDIDIADLRSPLPGTTSRSTRASRRLAFQRHVLRSTADVLPALGVRVASILLVRIEL